MKVIKAVVWTVVLSLIAAYLIYNSSPTYQARTPVQQVDIILIAWALGFLFYLSVNTVALIIYVLGSVLFGHSKKS